MIRKALVWFARAGLFAFLVALFAWTNSSSWTGSRLLMSQHADKVGHFLAMLFLTPTSLIALPKIPAHWLFVMATLLGGAIEVAQIFGPRSADLIDFLMSCLGVATVAIIYYGSLLRKLISNDLG